MRPDAREMEISYKSIVMVKMGDSESLNQVNGEGQVRAPGYIMTYIKEEIIDLQPSLINSHV